MSNYYNYILSAFILSFITRDAVASRKIMTQSNALPLIRLYWSCRAQERRTPRKGLVLPCIHAQMTELRLPHPIKHEQRDHLGHLCASPYPQFQTINPAEQDSFLCPFSVWHTKAPIS